MPGTGGYIRTSWRKSSESLNPQAIVGYFGKQSSMSGSGFQAFDIFTPLFMFSYWSVDMGTTGVTINAASAFCAAYGSAALSQLPNGGSGYRYLPVGIQTKYFTTSTGANGSQGGIWFSLCTSDDSAVTFCCWSPYTTNVSFCSASYNIKVTAFIVSTP